MNSKALFKEINTGVLRRVYLLHGEEEYAKDRAVEAFYNRVNEDLRDFNIDLLDSPDAERVIECARTLPMMSELRIVIARDPPFFVSAESQAKEVSAFIQQIPQSVTLLFVLRGKADARKSLFKNISKIGAVVNFEYYSEKEVANWACTYAKKRGTNLPLPIAFKLVNFTGFALSDVASETAKVCDYVGEVRAVTERDLELLIRPNLEYSVFNILESFLSGDFLNAFTLLEDTLSADERGAPIVLISFFGSRFRQMLRARILLDQGMRENSIIEALGGNSFAAKKSLEASKKFSKKALEEAVLMLGQADLDSKTGVEEGADALRRTLTTIFCLKKAGAGGSRQQNRR